MATHVSSVHVKGGNVYGQCLQIGWNFVPWATGYVCIEAKLVSWFKRWLKDNQSPVKKAAQDRFQLSDMLCTTKGQVNVDVYTRQIIKR